MLFNKFKNKKEWLTILGHLQKADPFIYLIILKMFLYRLNDNKIKILFEIVKETLKAIIETAK
jgi:hypothetical protein